MDHLCSASNLTTEAPPPQLAQGIFTGYINRLISAVQCGKLTYMKMQICSFHWAQWCFQVSEIRFCCQMGREKPRLGMSELVVKDRESALPGDSYTEHRSREA